MLLFLVHRSGSPSIYIEEVPVQEPPSPPPPTLAEQTPPPLVEQQQPPVEQPLVEPPSSPPLAKQPPPLMVEQQLQPPVEQQQQQLPVPADPAAALPRPLGQTPKRRKAARPPPPPPVSTAGKYLAFVSSLSGAIKKAPGGGGAPPKDEGWLKAMSHIASPRFFLNSGGQTGLLTAAKWSRNKLSTAPPPGTKVFLQLSLGVDKAMDDDPGQTLAISVDLRTAFFRDKFHAVEESIQNELRHCRIIPLSFRDRKGRELSICMDAVFNLSDRKAFTAGVMRILGIPRGF